jgi:hypothetical protein
MKLRNAMSRKIRVLLSIALLLVTAHRLPAPISEVSETTPTPKPKRDVTSRPKPKPETTPKPRATLNRSFAGTWTGSAGDSNGSAAYIIKISDDEKTVWINWDKSASDISGPGLQLKCNRFSETLTWTLAQETSTETDTLRINPDGTASFVRDGNVVAGITFLDPGGPFKISGVLSRQDFTQTPAIQTTAAAPQTIATVASKSSGGLPVAKPVPNKPGLVYNPFDPNSKTLLDVRGKAPGAKVKDPISGKLFIVP